MEFIENLKNKPWNLIIIESKYASSQSDLALTVFNEIFSVQTEIDRLLDLEPKVLVVKKDHFHQSNFNNIKSIKEKSTCRFLITGEEIHKQIYKAYNEMGFNYILIDNHAGINYQFDETTELLEFFKQKKVKVVLTHNMERHQSQNYFFYMADYKVKVNLHILDNLLEAKIDGVLFSGKHYFSR